MRLSCFSATTVAHLASKFQAHKDESDEKSLRHSSNFEIFVLKSLTSQSEKVSRIVSRTSRLSPGEIVLEVKCFLGLKTKIMEKISDYSEVEILHDGSVAKLYLGQYLTTQINSPATANTSCSGRSSRNCGPLIAVHSHVLPSTRIISVICTRRQYDEITIGRN